MAVEGQTIDERVVAEGAVTVTTDDYMITNMGPVIVDTFMQTMIDSYELVTGNTVDGASDEVVTFIVRTFDNAPAFAAFQVLLQDGTILAEVKQTFNSVATGYVSARNVFPNRVWVTADQTEPAWSNSDWWIRPRVVA